MLDLFLAAKSRVKGAAVLLPSVLLGCVAINVNSAPHISFTELQNGYSFYLQNYYALKPPPASNVQSHGSMSFRFSAYPT